MTDPDASSNVEMSDSSTDGAYEDEQVMKVTMGSGSWGFHVTERLLVFDINGHGTADKSELMLGDTIQSINETPIPSRAEFESFKKEARSGEATLTVGRSLRRRHDLETKLISPRLAPLAKFTADIVYLKRRVDANRPNVPSKFGIQFDKVEGRVRVIACEENSLGKYHFRLWDAILIINDNPVKDLTAIKNIIRLSKGVFTTIVERCRLEPDEIARKIEAMKKAKEEEAKSVMVTSDVRNIAMEAQGMYRNAAQTGTELGGGILLKKKGAAQFALNPEANVYSIRNENLGKELKKVGRADEGTKKASKSAEGGSGEAAVRGQIPNEPGRGPPMRPPYSVPKKEKDPPSKNKDPPSKKKDPPSKSGKK